MAKKDYYKTLCVKPIDKEADIKIAYKEMAKKYHPDLNPTMRSYAEEKMKEIVEAYDVISDREKRQQYDSASHFQLRIPAIMKAYDAQKLDIVERIRLSRKPKISLIDRIKKIFKKEKVDKEKIERNKRRQLTRKGMERFSMAMTYLIRNTPEIFEMMKYEFGEILKESPDNPETVYNMGIIEYRLGNFEEALHWFRKSQHHLKNDPDVEKMIELLMEE